LTTTKKCTTYKTYSIIALNETKISEGRDKKNFVHAHVVIAFSKFLLLDVMN